MPGRVSAVLSLYLKDVIEKKKTLIDVFFLSLCLFLVSACAVNLPWGSLA